MVELLLAFPRALWLFSPLLCALVLSAVVHRWDLFHRLATPIDGGHALGGRRIFGASKTWRGVVVAVVGSIVGVTLQKHLAGRTSLDVVDYARASPLALGGIMGAAAMAGELPNSFVKRRLGVPPGGTARSPGARALFWAWDQLDALTITWPALLPWVRPTLALVLASVLLTLVVHPVSALVGFAMGARASAR